MHVTCAPVTSYYDFTSSTPECTSYILSLGLLSAGDTPSLSVPNILLFSFLVFICIFKSVYSKSCILSTFKPLHLEKLFIDFLLFFTPSAAFTLYAVLISYDYTCIICDFFNQTNSLRRNPFACSCKTKSFFCGCLYIYLIHL